MGSGTSKSIVIDAKVRTSLEGMDRLRKELKTTLADNKLELSAGSSLAKLVNEYDEARKQLDAIISKGFVTPEENKKSKQLSERVANIYTDIVKSLSKIENLEIPDLKKMFPSNFSAKTTKGLKEISNYYEKLGDKEITLMGLDIANKELFNMETTLQNLQNKRTKVQIDVDIEAANKRIQEIEEKKKALQNEVYDSLIPKETRDSQGKTQRERDQEEVKKAQEVYDAAIQLRNNLKKSKARAQNQQDLADLELINKNERDELAANQLEKAQAKQIKEKLEREVSRRTGANPSRGKGYEAVEDKDIQAQYLVAVDNLERLRTETAEIKKKYKARREEVEERPKAELTQARKNAETQVEVAKQNLDAAKQAQKTNAEARQIQEDIARQKAEKFASGEEVQGVSADKVEEQRQYNEQLKKQLQIQEQLSEEKKTAFKDQETKDSSIAAQDIKIQKKKQDIKELENALTSLGDMTNVDKVFSSLEELGVDTDGIERTEAGLQQIRESLLAINSTTADNIRKHLREVGMSAEDAAEAVKEMREGLKAMDDKDLGIKQQEREIEDLQQSFLHFFSIGNAIELFKRTVRASIETVKELDAVMTETAVVTDFTVSDMWKKLPTYAKQASQLGASIKDLYSATTLYYQQGLDTDQAMSVGVETMKMARIASMESSDATKAMTAALRGFNMEINETSATRINDVYSELAAITAADTKQIATAMGKTASIASSANMEFETTAALLAQIIETTQEAPETAGTAMKTIIARFTEVKELFDEGLLTGEDEEGESIDINKIDAALKKVGISLKDFLRGERGIDDIFLELASKWDSLDLATQRYIATTAAGSRQQSRFIAMMSNYERTMELVNAANNSAGASQEQYEKTLDSMEAKLQKLKNAWDTFVMNLANNDLLKAGVDVLTFLLETVNSLTDALSGGNGLSKTLLSFATAFGALKLGKTGINLFSEGLFGKKFLPEGKTLEQLTEGRMQSVFAGFQKGIKNGNFASVFTETVFDRKGFKQAAKAASKQYEKMLADPELKSEEVKKAYTTKKELLDKASTGDVEAGRQAGMQIDTFGLDKARVSLTGVSTAAMGAGMAIGMVGGALQNAGFEKGGEAASDFGSALMGLGTAASALSPMLATLGLSAGWLTAIIVGISAVYAGAKYMIQTMYEKSPEGRLEAAQEAAEQAGKAAEATAESYDKLKESIESIGEKRSDLDKLTEGTDEWRQAVRELNSEVLDLVDKYPELSNFIVRDSKGILSIDYNNAVNGKTAQQVIDTYEENVGASKTAKYLADANVVQKQPDVAFANFEREIIRNPQSPIKLDRESTDALAKAYALGQIDFDENGNPMANEWLEQQGYKTRVISGLDYNKLEQYGNSLIDNERSYENTLQNAAFAAMDNASFDSVTGALMQNLDYDILQAGMKATTESFKSQYENQELTDDDKLNYARYQGYEYKDQQWFDSAGNKIEAPKDDSIRNYLAYAEGSKAFTAYLENFNQVLSGLGETGQIAGQLLSNEGIKIPKEIVEQYREGLDLDQLLGTENIEAMAKALGMNPDNFRKVVKQNLDYAQKRVDQQRLDNAKKTKKFNQKFTKEQAVQFSEQRDVEQYANFLAALEDIGDEALSTAAFDAYAKAGVAASEEITAFTESINWQNPIEAAKKLKAEAEHGTEATRNYAKALLEVSNSSIGASSQLKYFWQTASGEDFHKDLSEIISEQSEITGANVLELADKYTSLEDIMNNTGATAEGMAKALELVGRKEIDIEHMSDAVLASLVAFDGLSSVIHKTLNELSKFDAGLDENDVSNFIGEASDKISENIEKGALGNSQNRKYLDFLLGADWDKDITPQEYEDTLRWAASQLEKNKDNMLSSWKDLAEGRDFYGREFDKGLLNGLEVNLTDKGGIELTGYENKTTDQIVADLAKAYNTSEQYARMMLTDFSNYSTELMAELSKNDFTTGLKKTYEGLSELGGVKIIDETEIQALSEIFGVSRESITDQLNLSGDYIITNFYDKDGILKESHEIVSEINRVWQESGNQGDFTSSLLKTDVKGQATLAYQEIMDQLAKLHIPEEAKTSIANEVASSFGDGILNYKLPTGETVEIPVKVETTAEDIQAEINKKITQNDGKLYAQGFIEALQGADSNFSLKIDVEQAQAQIQGLSDTSITPSLEIEPLNSQIQTFRETQSSDPIEISVDVSNTEEVTTETETAVQSANTEIHVTATGIDAIKQAIDKAIPSSKTISVGVSLRQSEVSVSGSASGTIYISAHKDGIKNSSTSHPALVSEEGAELIQTKDGAYLTGQNGPEIVNIDKGDTVYTAEETKKILKGNKRTSIPRYAKGYEDVKPKNNGNSDSNSEKAENPYDFLYNLLREIQEENRRRERIERRYEKLLDDADVNAQKLIDISREELEQLKENRKLEEKRIDAREKQINQYQKENQDLTKYARTETNEYGEQVLRIDWDAINAVTDPDQMERIETYVSQLEEWYSDMEEAQDTLEDIEDQMEEIRLRGRDEYIDLENKIKDAIVAERQEEIDKLSEINNSINDTNAELIDAIQKTLDKQRRERDNQRTEEDLAEKQRRLLYLQQDTSGANDLEILELQKELDTEYEDYTDTLIDQKISDLQAQNDEAAKAREQQITLMQAQLDKQVQNGEIWAEVERLMATGISQTEGLVKGSELEALLKQTDGFKGLSETQKMVWMQETNSQIALAATYLNNLEDQIKDLNEGMNRQTAIYEQAVKTPSVPQNNSGSGSGSGSGTGGGGGGGGSVNNGSLTEAQVQELQKYLGLTADGLWGTKSKNAAAAMWGSDYSSADKAWKKYQETKNKDTSSPKPDSSSPKPIAKDYNDSSNGGKPPLYSASYQVWDKAVGKNLSKETRKFATETEARTEARKLIRKFYIEKEYVGGTLEEMIGKAANTIKITKYKTGGLANFTGPAWLDGTKSHPELVLNQRDTQNFIQLKDILSQIMSHNLPNSVSTENNGEITYDIDINVESMTSDYDVEQMANKVKSMINSDARYRNNNAISLKR